MVDSEMFSALRVRGRLEDIARTIAEARVTGDVYASLDAVEHALLAVMDEVAEIAQAVSDTRLRMERDGGRPRRLGAPLHAVSIGRSGVKAWPESIVAARAASAGGESGPGATSQADPSRSTGMGIIPLP